MFRNLGCLIQNGVCYSRHGHVTPYFNGMSASGVRMKCQHYKNTAEHCPHFSLPWSLPISTSPLIVQETESLSSINRQSPIGFVVDYVSMENSTFTSMENNIYTSVKSSIYTSMENSIYTSMESSIYTSIESSINISMENSIYTSMESSINTSMENSIYTSMDNSIYTSRKA